MLNSQLKKHTQRIFNLTILHQIKERSKILNTAYSMQDRKYYIFIINYLFDHFGNQTENDFGVFLMCFDIIKEEMHGNKIRCNKYVPFAV